MRIVLLCLILAALPLAAPHAQETPMPSALVPPQPAKAEKDVTMCDARTTANMFDDLTTLKPPGPDCSYQQLIAGMAGGLPCTNKDDCLRAMMDAMYFDGMPTAFESKSYQLSATPVTPATR